MSKHSVACKGEDWEAGSGGIPWLPASRRERRDGWGDMQPWQCRGHLTGLSHTVHCDPRRMLLFSQFHRKRMHQGWGGILSIFEVLKIISEAPCLARSSGNSIWPRIFATFFQSIFPQITLLVPLSVSWWWSAMNSTQKGLCSYCEVDLKTSPTALWAQGIGRNGMQWSRFRTEVWGVSFS